MVIFSNKKRTALFLSQMFQNFILLSFDLIFNQIDPSAVRDNR